MEGRYTLLKSLIKTKIGILAIITAGYIGAEKHHLIYNMEQNVFFRHQPYESTSHTGDLDVVRVQNANGRKEQKLKNLDTNQLCYTIAPDLLPDNNNFILDAMDKRVNSMDPDTLQKIYCRSDKLAESAEARLYQNTPVADGSVNPLRADLKATMNKEGKLEAILTYNGKSVVLGEEQWKKLTETAKVASIETKVDTEKPAEAPLTDQGGSRLPILSLLGIGGLCGGAYLVKRRYF